MNIQSFQGGFNITISKEIYNIDVLHKCFYWYSSDYAIDISSESPNSFMVTINYKTAGEPTNQEILIERIKADLIDFKLRDIVTKETMNIRDLLIAKAFANYEFNESPAGEISDPVGYNPY